MGRSLHKWGDARPETRRSCHQTPPDQGRRRQKHQARTAQALCRHPVAEWEAPEAIQAWGVPPEWAAPEWEAPEWAALEWAALEWAAPGLEAALEAGAAPGPESAVVQPGQCYC